MRIDKWLFFSRLFKTRSKAVKAIDKGKVFLNGKLVRKQSQLIKIGDGIIIKKSNDILRFTIINFSNKRENYDLAKNLYENKIEEIKAGIIKSKDRCKVESKKLVLVQKITTFFNKAQENK